MVLEAVLRIDDARDAALRVVAVGFLHRVLGDHEERKSRVDFHRSPQAGNAAADHEHIDEMVWYPLGMKRQKISWNGERHLPILLAILPSTRDTLIVGSQPLLILKR